MVYGKAITLFLIDAEPTGRIAAELLNWTGKIYKIPRARLKDSASRVELQQAGVYLLFGRNDVDPEMPHVYVGKAEEVYKRVGQHQDRDFWNEAVICISKDENLNKAHIKFLEHELYNALHEVGRAEVRNNVIPPQPRIAEHEQAFLLEFFGNLKLLVSSLGYRVFEPQRKSDLRQQAAVYFIRAARGADAQALRSDEGMVVLKNSRAASSLVASAQSWVSGLRQHLLDTGVLDSSWTFLKDYTFSSPSTAASVVLERNANGLTEWKDNQKRTLKTIEDAGQ